MLMKLQLVATCLFGLEKLLGEELDALDDILSKKVLRKLETQNPVYIRSVVDGFCDYLDELFGADKMKLCKEYVQRLKKNA